jgi:hypothetical protein
MKQYFLGLITRCKDEFFIKEFCDYYISQGVDKIYIIDDNSKDKSIYNKITSKDVELIYKTNIFKQNKRGSCMQMYTVNKLYKKIRNNFKWLISVDVDEFITTKKHKNNTIKRELKTTFKNVDCVCVPWVMMSSNGRKKNPKSILLENTYRWNHDLTHLIADKKYKKFTCRYNEIQIKCIFKTNEFDTIQVHCPHNRKSNRKRLGVNSTTLDKVEIASSIVAPREKNIKNGYLVCYHYRLISKENTLAKIKKTQYKQFEWKEIQKYDYAEIKDETLKNKIKGIK